MRTLWFAEETTDKKRLTKKISTEYVQYFFIQYLQRLESVCCVWNRLKFQSTTAKSPLLEVPILCSSNSEVLDSFSIKVFGGEFNVRCLWNAFYWSLAIVPVNGMPVRPFITAIIWHDHHSMGTIVWRPYNDRLSGRWRAAWKSVWSVRIVSKRYRISSMCFKI